MPGRAVAGAVPGAVYPGDGRSVGAQDAEFIVDGDAAHAGPVVEILSQKGVEGGHGDRHHVLGRLAEVLVNALGTQGIVARHAFGEYGGIHPQLLRQGLQGVRLPGGPVLQSALGLHAFPPGGEIVALAGNCASFQPLPSLLELHRIHNAVAGAGAAVEDFLARRVGPLYNPLPRESGALAAPVKEPPPLVAEIYRHRVAHQPVHREGVGVVAGAPGPGIAYVRLRPQLRRHPVAVPHIGGYGEAQDFRPLPDIIAVNGPEVVVIIEVGACGQDEGPGGNLCLAPRIHGQDAGHCTVGACAKVHGPGLREIAHAPLDSGVKELFRNPGAHPARPDGVVVRLLVQIPPPHLKGKGRPLRGPGKHRPIAGVQAVKPVQEGAVGPDIRPEGVLVPDGVAAEHGPEAHHALHIVVDTQPAVDRFGAGESGPMGQIGPAAEPLGGLQQNHVQPQICAPGRRAGAHAPGADDHNVAC